MGLIKITEADRWFSKCVRERAGWKCEVCHKQYQEGDQGLGCSHIYSRRHKSIRHHGDNGTSMCTSCHQRLGGNPLDFASWARTHLGESRLDMLRERKNSPIKYNKRLEREIAAHYREEHRKMKEARARGTIGRLEFVSWL